MKISKSKQELARIISENGGWRDGDFAVQDKDSWVCFYKGKQTRCGDYWEGKGDCQYRFGFTQDNTLPNWHQTILSRAEYFQLYPAPDADGWIEWNGAAKSPVSKGTPVDVKMQNGTQHFGQLIDDACWSDCWGDASIIAYRLHKQQSKPEFCESVMRSIPEPSDKPTIEQLAADCRNLLEFARRKRQEADAAKADADEKLRVPELAGKALGLLVSPITAKQKPELVITDLLYLRVGDMIWIGDSGSIVNCPEGEYEIVEIDNEDQEQCVGVEWDGSICWPQLRKRNWKFIRRP